MPRIRTIKPEFWSDAVIVELSMPARLFFIGTWNFADDSGNVEYSVKQLKMRIFPADAIEVQPLIDELTTTGVLVEYEVDGKKYLNIKNFKEHQVINKPSKTRLPEMNTTVALPYGREGKGREGNRKGKERKGVKRGNGRFAPPKLEEVIAYCRERNNNIDPQYFIDKNTSIGWVVGRNKVPMRDWKATIRTWERFQKERDPPSGNEKRQCVCGKKGRVKHGNQWFCNRCFDEKGL